MCRIKSGSPGIVTGEKTSSLRDSESPQCPGQRIILSSAYARDSYTSSNLIRFRLKPTLPVEKSKKHGGVRANMENYKKFELSKAEDSV
jgi:hypothetical protein